MAINRYHMNGAPIAINRYHMNGAPTHCQNPRCMCEFVGACFHGPDNRYYCTRHCYHEAEDSGLRKIERLARQMQ
jgi:hypothetical protein